MPNPLLIGGLVVGGTLAAWRFSRPYRRRLKTIVERIRLGGDATPERPIPLERDPATGIYRPVQEERD